MKKKRQPLNKEARALFLIAIGALLLISFFSFSVHHPHQNYLGFVGYIIAMAGSYLFGLSAFLIPAYLIWLGSQDLKKKKPSEKVSSHLFFLILLGSTCMLLSVFADYFPDRAQNFDTRVFSTTHVYLGGVPWLFVYSDLPIFNLKHILSPIGTTLIFSTLVLISFLVITQVNILLYLKAVGNAILQLCKSAAHSAKKLPLPSPTPRHPPIIEEAVKEIIRPHAEKEAPPIKKREPIEKLKPALNPKEIETLAEKLPTYLPVKYDDSYQLPSCQLLSTPTQKIDQPQLKKDLKRQSEVLEETLKSFGIDAKVGEIHCGPTITSFEVQPSIGVKVQKIKSLENDIALNMQAQSIRIIAPIPGKAAVGVEVPALHPQNVGFKELLQYYQQKSRKLQIPILLGKGVSGDPVCADLTKMPHLLIAGATGSGKSVCINTIVMSILMNSRPEEIRLLMVDPKKVELTQYSKLPHMIAPVITESHGAYAALQWLVKEMQRRYEILKQLGLRNITAFNNRKINPEVESALTTPIPSSLPLIVAIIDEFADLMMVSSADLETPIARIAQMARAVGIHLILATQRPSREVITGIIKANITCRIAFKVASRVNSQIILDDNGAESLLGNGDCLFLPPGTSQLIRAQGAYISDEDINQIVQYVSAQASPNYLIPSFDAFRSLDGQNEDSEIKGRDALYDQALVLVVQSKLASTTYLQRKLKIGYARAASLMDELEENGIISPQDGSKPRRVLTSNMTIDDPL